MKHRYNPVGIVLTFVILALFSFFMFYFFPDYVKAYSGGKSGLDTMLMGFPVAIPCFMFMNNMGRHVEVLGEYVKFNNFRFSVLDVFKTFTITLGYESIVGIDSKKLPLIGIYKLVIISKNYPNPIPVSMLFFKYKKLFYTLSTNARRYNKEIIFDNDLEEFLERYKEKYD